MQDDESSSLGPSYHLHYSDGHSPGMMLTEIPSRQGPVLYASSLIPGRAWVHRSITMSHDRFPELLIDEKKHLLHELAKSNGRVFFSHDADVALARITIDSHGRFGSTHFQKELAGYEV